MLSHPLVPIRAVLFADVASGLGDLGRRLASRGTWICRTGDKNPGGADYQGGLIVHLGCGDGRLTAALGAADQAVVQGLDSDPALVAEAREHIRLLGRYGRVSVGAFDGKQLPYADNLVNLVVVSDGGSQVSDEEIQRVLCPGGVAWYESEIERRKAEGQAPDAGTGWHKAVKPWPEELDQWTHFLYDASGNAVSRDRRVGPPQRLQWDGGPRWSRSHETDMSLTAAVTSGGRIFHTLDEGPIGVHETPRERRRLPDKCSLVARDAFNGIELWKRPLPDWGSAAWDNARWRWGINDQLWSSPLTLPRRLVADGDRVYVTLGFRAGVSELDAATGKRYANSPRPCGGGNRAQPTNPGRTRSRGILRRGRRVDRGDRDRIRRRLCGASRSPPSRISPWPSTMGECASTTRAAWWRWIFARESCCGRRKSDRQDSARSPRALW
jgi:hypothetical protein